MQTIAVAPCFFIVHPVLEMTPYVAQHTKKCDSGTATIQSC